MLFEEEVLLFLEVDVGVLLMDIAVGGINRLSCFDQ